MINADRYHHTGRTYVNISRAPVFDDIPYLGLTPQAKMCRRFAALWNAAFFPRGAGAPGQNLPPLRGSLPSPVRVVFGLSCRPAPGSWRAQDGFGRVGIPLRITDVNG